ncbi:3153_t:CDS:2, partial [Cetraspora pellucida]
VPKITVYSPRDKNKTGEINCRLALNPANTVVLYLDPFDSGEVQWCLENLDSMIEEEDKTYLQIIAKKVFGRQPTQNQYAMTQAILHNLFDPELVKIKFDEKYLTRKLSIFLV